MPQQSTESYWRYSPPAVVLHWLIALFIFTLFVLGRYIMTIEHRPGGADWWFNLHRSLGLTVAGFVVLRILWRVSHRPAELSANMLRGKRSWHARRNEALCADDRDAAHRLSRFFV